MSIYYSHSLIERHAAMVARTAGSEAVITFYSGEMPEYPETAAGGEKMGATPADEISCRQLARGQEPRLPEGATYWRLIDNGGLVLMQGDCK